MTDKIEEHMEKSLSFEQISIFKDCTIGDVDCANCFEYSRYGAEACGEPECDGVIHWQPSLKIDELNTNTYDEYGYYLPLPLILDIYCCDKCNETNAIFEIGEDE